MKKPKSERAQNEKEPALPKINSLTLKGKFTGHDIIEKQRNHLEPEELNNFFEALDKDPFWYPYFYIEYYFGCRISEPALILDKEDISFSSDMMVIRRLKKRDTAEGFTEYVYGLNPGLRNVISLVRKWNNWCKLGDNPFLFPSPRAPSHRAAKERLGQLRRIGNFLAISRMSAHTAFKRAAQKAKIPDRLCHAHVLRHTRATLMLAAGAPGLRH